MIVRGVSPNDVRPARRQASCRFFASKVTRGCVTLMGQMIGFSSNIGRENIDPEAADALTTWVSVTCRKPMCQSGLQESD
jgi:hypothetical protein